MEVYYDSIKAFNAEIFIAASDRGLCFVSNNYQEMVTWLAKREVTNLVENTSKVKFYKEIFQRYFDGENVDFQQVPIDVKGTDFQRRVWKELRNIKKGEVCSYSDVAQNIQKPTSVRAVATAIGKNPLLILIPCHRVIGKDGTLTGFRSGLALKENLLQLEGISV